MEYPNKKIPKTKLAPIGIKINPDGLFESFKMAFNPKIPKPNNG